MAIKRREEAGTVIEKPEDNNTPNPNDLKKAMLEVGIKLCSDILNGRVRNEETALRGIVEIFKEVRT